MNQRERWEALYQATGEQCLFGTTPAAFLTQRAELFQPGQTAFLAADGEGRNSVWLAERGLQVTAVDIAPVAVARAQRLAQERGMTATFMEADMLGPDWSSVIQLRQLRSFDWVLGVFIQFASAQERQIQFARLKSLVRPGGRILLHGYTPKQLEYRTGGPSELENLYTPKLLSQWFSAWQIEELTEYEAEVDEGVGHRGMSALIGMVARKPAL
jgi:SAM-dependent methyltransferase